LKAGEYMTISVKDGPNDPNVFVKSWNNKADIQCGWGDNDKQ
jgi:hypothetical protein